MTGGGARPAQLADYVSEAWVGFAATGAPVSMPHGLPPWPPYDLERRATLLIDDTSFIALDPTHEEREFLGS